MPAASETRGTRARENGNNYITERGEIERRKSLLVVYARADCRVSCARARAFVMTKSSLARSRCWTDHEWRQHVCVCVTVEHTHGRVCGVLYAVPTKRVGVIILFPHRISFDFVVFDKRGRTREVKEDSGGEGGLERWRRTRREVKEDDGSFLFSFFSLRIIITPQRFRIVIKIKLLSGARMWIP